MLRAILIWLVVGPPLWKIWKSIGMTIPNIWENKKCSKPPTSYVSWLHETTCKTLPHRVESSPFTSITSHENCWGLLHWPMATNEWLQEPIQMLEVVDFFSNPVFPQWTFNELPCKCCDSTAPSCKEHHLPASLIMSKSSPPLQRSMTT